MPSLGRLLSAFLVTVLLAGCVSGTVITTVDDDGTIAETEMEVEVDEFVYAILAQEAADAGYDDIQDRLESEGERVYAEVEYSEEPTEDGVRLTQTMRDGDPDATDSIDVDVTEEEILYVDHEGPGTQYDIDAEHLDSIDLRWVVHMPGEIVDTNGDVREDNQSVEWTLDEHGHLESFYVTSERPDESESSPLSPVAIALGVITVASLVLAISVRAYRQ